METQPLIEMSVFTNKIGDIHEIMKVLQQDGMKILYDGFIRVDALCTEEYANNFAKKLIDNGIDYHAIGY